MLKKDGRNHAYENKTPPLFIAPSGVSSASPRTGRVGPARTCVFEARPSNT